MKKKGIGQHSLKELLDAFDELSRAQSLAIDQWDTAKHNRLSARVSKISEEIRNRGLEAREAVLPFLESDNPVVRRNAISICYKIAPKRCIEILEWTVKTSYNPHDVNASFALDALRAGHFNPD